MLAVASGSMGASSIDGHGSRGSFLPTNGILDAHHRHQHLASRPSRLGMWTHYLSFGKVASSSASDRDPPRDVSVRCFSRSPPPSRAAAPLSTSLSFDAARVSDEVEDGIAWRRPDRPRLAARWVFFWRGAGGPSKVAMRTGCGALWSYGSMEWCGCVPVKACWGCARADGAECSETVLVERRRVQRRYGR